MGENMKKKFKAKRHIKAKYIPYLMIMLLIIISIITLSYISKNKSTINSLLNESNIFKTNIKEETKEITKIITGVNLNEPVTLINSHQTNEQIVFNFEHNEIKKEQEPEVYIYNTHQTEEYIGDELLPTPTVQTGAYYLKDKLESLGIKTIVEEANIKQILEENNWNYTQSYKASRINLEKIKNEYPSIKIFIDFHRDSVKRELSTVTINEKNYAKILFVIGKEHQNYNQNLEFTTKLNDIIEKNYKELTKGILQKEGWGVNGIYNQDIKENVILMEVGANENTFEEVTNTLDLIAPLIKEDING